jgi:xanthine dehydrogenase YagT iron-sulfur-binding subunit
MLYHNRQDLPLHVNTDEALMAGKKEKSTLSRRSFVQRLGAGAVGATVAAKLPADAFAEKPGENGHEYHEGSAMLEFMVNGRPHRLWIEARATLAEVLRDRLGLTGTKVACDRGMCGSCTVLLDNLAVYSCHTLALDAVDKSVTTIEGLLDGEKLHPLQQAFLEHDGLQCGFCTPGQVMAAHALLLGNPHPSKDEIITGMSGNLCRCAAYPKIIDSVVAAAKA